MTTRLCQWFWSPALLTVLVAALGCSGVSGSAPDTIGQQLPFSERKPRVIPANTIVYVRLQQPITSSTAQAGQHFSAVLDEPLLVDSQVAVPQGAEIAGEVVVARDSGRLHSAGYVRITLCSVTLNGKTIAMQTTSAMAGGGHFRNRDFSFMKGGVDPSLSRSFVSHSFQASQTVSPPAASGKGEAGFAANVRIGFRLTQPLNIG
jgi:hypothetical protein